MKLRKILVFITMILLFFAFGTCGSEPTPVTTQPVVATPVTPVTPPIDGIIVPGNSLAEKLVPPSANTSPKSDS